VSGFSQVTFPLTPAAEEAIRALDVGTHNWVQLALNNPPTQIDVVITKTISSGELSEVVHPVDPQFYLYNKEGTIVLIYCCPDKVSEAGFSQTIKNRMVYSTCKASCAESIKSLGITNVKKFDIRDPSDLTEEGLTAHLSTKVAALFSGSELRGSPQRNMSTPTRNQGFDSSQYRGNTPVFNRPGYSQPHEVNSAYKERQPKPGSLAGLMASTGTGKLPKGVVLPPKGAYC